MSDAEEESLRQTAVAPMDRIVAYEKMLDDREHTIDTLVNKPHRPAFASDMHDAIEQIGAIADELNDNLDEYKRKMRDVRKVLPKLIAATERYDVVRKIALSALTDTHDLAVEMQDAQVKYAKEHPEWAKAEAERVAPKFR